MVDKLPVIPFPVITGVAKAANGLLSRETKMVRDPKSQVDMEMPWEKEIYVIKIFLNPVQTILESEE